ncbi:MAG TPA: ScpA family protein [Caulobacteraceae bacterium]|nr:ScpA family protein [Caulobacteraceae bacterium]
MSPTDQPSFDFADAEAAAEEGAAFVIDLDGYEGPLHVLLALARAQKVDLLKLSVADLADQYLTFIAQAQRANFTLAADYLVMAAWLAYLKSRLLLPVLTGPKDGERPANELAQDLALRLLKLDALRKAGEALQARPRLGRDVFGRGDPDAVQVSGTLVFEGDLYALVQAYVAQRQRTATHQYRPEPARAYALEDARHRLRDKLPELRAWTALAAVAPFASAADPDGPTRASYLASTLAAGLELVREGELEARQLEQFADIYLRARLRLEAAE